MAVTERPERKMQMSENGTRTRMYTVTGAADEDAAASQLITALTDAGLLTIGGLTLSNVHPTEIDGLGTWVVAATWSVFQRRDAQTETATDQPGERSFEIVMQRQRVYRSEETIHSIKAGGGNAPDFKRAIGVVDGRIEGVDIPQPQVSFSETVVKPKSFVTLSYIDTLTKMVGTTNNAEWRGFAANRVILVGVSGSIRDSQNYSIAYRFGLGEHETTVDIGNGITLPTKNAWDVVWAITQKVEQTAGGDKFTVDVPIYAYVERVFKRTAFSDLGLGTSG